METIYQKEVTDERVSVMTDDLTVTFLHQFPDHKRMVHFTRGEAIAAAKDILAHFGDDV